ncbi:MAG: 2-oxo-4-hydroxy-4-carboxy-5-ureidoimidazoline decarboxylase [Cyclobacteriaceae bacterium]|nr:2-oxo-4-hydroxy-4-carboxy-5-ureidoimidazoline decarboxylase [Cyclobacteriaceae bacterium]
MGWSLSGINQASGEELKHELINCCGSHKWVQSMIDERPYFDTEHLLFNAQNIWSQLTPEDWKEAFDHHPQIGDLNSLKQKFASTARWAANEQKGTLQSDEETLIQLADFNQQYLDKFGYIFIICATGKSAEEMLQALKSRINNEEDQEITIAAAEQAQITQLRLQKLLI